MAKRQHTADDGTREYDVLLRLRLAEDTSDVAIEELAIKSLEALESYATSCVIGPAVGFKLQPPEIELDFNVEAENTAEVYQVIARAHEIIVGETGIEFDLGTEMKR